MHTDTRRWLRGTLMALGLGLGLGLPLGPAWGDDWPQWLGPRRDSVWREDGILAKFPQGGPKVLWHVPVGGGYSGPAVVGDRVFVMDRQLPVDNKPPDPNKLGDPTKGLGDGKERVLCFSVKDGKPLWKHEYDCKYSKVAYPSGPRATPTVDEGRVYTLGTMGDVFCLEADGGKEVWHVNLPNEYKTKWPVWGYAAHPLVVGDKLITLAGGAGSAVVALDKKTGKESWKALTTEEIGYSPPILVQAGGRQQLIVWLSESLNSLDPDTGKMFWSVAYPEDGKPQRPSVNIMAPRLAGDLLFVANFYHGPLVVKLAADKPDATVAWRSKSDNPLKPYGVNPVMNTPVVKDDFTYGITGMGELRCVDLKDGSTRWETLEAVGGKRDQFMTAFVVENQGRFFIFNEHGELLIAKMSPEGFTKIDSATIIKATMPARGGRDVVWCHPAFAHRCLFVRNDEEMVCVSLAK
jgi:outer membrane protein assembly factor BamB